MVRGPEEALRVMDGLTEQLGDYHLLHAARADMLRRLELPEEATKSYTRALELATNDSERRFLKARLRQVGSGAATG